MQGVWGIRMSTKYKRERYKRGEREVRRKEKEKERE